MYDMIIDGGMVIDGTGADAYRADVAIEDGRFAAVGDLTGAQAAARLDAGGRYVTPGFIDMHSHADCSVAFYPRMESCLVQGVTTVFTGHCGLGVAPVDRYWVEMFAEERAISRVLPQSVRGQRIGFDRVIETDRLAPAISDVFGVELDWRTWGEFARHLERKGIGANMIGVVGHAQLRHQAMGLDYRRAATQDEIASMKRLLSRSLDEGAWGLGIGLDYSPGIYADTAELNALAELVAARGGILTGHVRTRNNRQDPAKPQMAIAGIREFLDIGLHTGARVHISHIMPGYAVQPYDGDMARLAARRTLDAVEEYRSRGVAVTWDVLPKHTLSIFNNIQLAGRLMPYVKAAGGKRAFARCLHTGTYRQDLAKELKAGEHISISSFVRIDPVANPDWDRDILITRAEDIALVGKSLREVGEGWGMDGVDAMLELLSRDAEVFIMRRWTDEVAAADCFASRAEACVGLDNASYDLDYRVDERDMPIQKTQPAAYGGMVKFLSYKPGPRFEDDIRKLTGNAARALRLADRGTIREGNAADVLVLNEKELDARENPVDPGQAPAGIDYVLVNGRIAVDHARIVNAAGGRVLPRP